jgi:hypothetical protein
MMVSLSFVAAEVTRRIPPPHVVGYDVSASPTFDALVLFGTADKLVNLGMVRLTDEITQVVRPAEMVMGKW